MIFIHGQSPLPSCILTDYAGQQVLRPEPKVIVHSFPCPWLLLGSVIGHSSVKVTYVTVVWYGYQQGFQAVRQSKQEREMSKRRICFNKFVHN